MVLWPARSDSHLQCLVRTDCSHFSIHPSLASLMAACRMNQFRYGYMLCYQPGCSEYWISILARLTGCVQGELHQ